jgi:hypothetical protein
MRLGLESLARDKRSSLLCKVVTYGRKKFYNIGHQVALSLKLFFFINDVAAALTFLQDC